MKLHVKDKQFRFNSDQLNKQVKMYMYNELNPVNEIQSLFDCFKLRFNNISLGFF